MAKAEGTVAHLSNLFDTFFEGGRDHRVERASITHMPYFEGARGAQTLRRRPSALGRPPSVKVCRRLPWRAAGAAARCAIERRCALRGAVLTPPPCALGVPLVSEQAESAPVAACAHRARMHAFASAHSGACLMPARACQATGPRQGAERTQGQGEQCRQGALRQPPWAASGAPIASTLQVATPPYVRRAPPGDYWPGEAELVLDALNDAARREGKKGAGGKGGGRAKGAKGKRYGVGLASADAHVMTRIAEVIQGMKEDFIVVHLQEPCSFCRAYISDATRCGAAPLALRPARSIAGAAPGVSGVGGARPTSRLRKGGSHVRWLGLRGLCPCPSCSRGAASRRPCLCHAGPGAARAAAAAAAPGPPGLTAPARAPPGTTTRRRRRARS